VNARRHAPSSISRRPADKRRKAPAKAQPSPQGQSKLQPAFTEDFIAPLALRPRQPLGGAPWGPGVACPARDGPVREVAVERSLAGPHAALVTLYALTAMVEVRGKRVRMLLDAGGSTAVIGTRIWSTPRLAGGAVAALGGLAALGLALALLWQPAPPGACYRQGRASEPERHGPG
jgi:hypothetical protein